jgi:hypothetical protein
MFTGYYSIAWKSYLLLFCRRKDIYHDIFSYIVLHIFLYEGIISLSLPVVTRSTTHADPFSFCMSNNSIQNIGRKKKSDPRSQLVSNSYNFLKFKMFAFKILASVPKEKFKKNSINGPQDQINISLKHSNRLNSSYFFPE